MVAEVRIVVSSRRGIFGWEVTKRGFWSFGNVLCLALVGNYTDVYTDIITLFVHFMSMYSQYINYTPRFGFVFF